jgi:hypothetical protein
MDTKTFIKALKVAVREVIKEELTEILREGLQSTLTEMKRPVGVGTSKPPIKSVKRKPLFEDNKWASVLNDTEPLTESQPLAMNSFKEVMNEYKDNKDAFLMLLMMMITFYLGVLFEYIINKHWKNKQ